MELGIMGIITPFADAASPIYANSGYLPAKDYWRLGTIFGALFLFFFLAVGVRGHRSCGENRAFEQRSKHHECNGYKSISN